MTSDPPQSAILTGAASGLGRALAVRLARDHWRLALIDLNLPQLEETQRLVAAAGGQASCLVMDVRDAAAWQGLAADLRARWPRLDLLINNAGVCGAGVCGAGALGEFSLDDWHWLLATNLHGPIYGCHHLIPWLKENPRGAHIINTASIAGVLGAPSMGAYNVSKAGLIALSETLYSELRPYGIGVTVLCPGFFGSQLVDNGRFGTERHRREAIGWTQSARLTAERLADRAVRAIAHKRLYVVEPRRARWFWRAKRWAPGLFHKLLTRAVERWSSGPDPPV